MVERHSIHVHVEHSNELARSYLVYNNILGRAQTHTHTQTHSLTRGETQTECVTNWLPSTTLTEAPFIHNPYVQPTTDRPTEYETTPKSISHTESYTTVVIASYTVLVVVVHDLFRTMKQ